MRLFVSLGLAVVLYLGVALVPVGQKYFAIRYAAKVIANQVQMEGRQDYRTIRRALDALQRETGMRLAGSDLEILRGDGGTQVRVTAQLPVSFPLVDWQTSISTVVSAHATSTGYR